DRRAGPADRELCRGLARDRHHAAINFRRVGCIHRNLGFACLLALLERRIVEEGKAHVALDLEGAVAGEKNRCRVRVDPLHLLSTIGGRIGEEAEDLLLVVRVLAHGSKFLAPPDYSGPMRRGQKAGLTAHLTAIKAYNAGRPSRRAPSRRCRCAGRTFGPPPRFWWINC